MWKENLYRPIEVLLREHDDFPLGEHQHSFYEMVYIIDGTGYFDASVFGSSQGHSAYHKGDLFLIPPDCPHIFEVKTRSQFIFIRFTQNYLSDYANDKFEPFLKIKYGFRVNFSDDDFRTVGQLMNTIFREASNRQHLSEQLLQYYVNAIILLCTRSLSEITSAQDNINNNKPQYMLQYIQQHIHQPECLKLALLADKFNISPKYVGRFFKRNFGEDYTQYLLRNRLKRVEDMLINTKMTIKEIAIQMGYVDSCYLNRLFTRQYGITPLQFRKQNSHLYGILNG